jgi:hypothetical protein
VFSTKTGLLGRFHVLGKLVQNRLPAGVVYALQTLAMGAWISKVAADKNMVNDMRARKKARLGCLVRTAQMVTG